MACFVNGTKIGEVTTGDHVFAFDSQTGKDRVVLAYVSGGPEDSGAVIRCRAPGIGFAVSIR